MAHYCILKRLRNKLNLKCAKCLKRVVYAQNLCKKHYDEEYLEVDFDSALILTPTELESMSQPYNSIKTEQWTIMKNRVCPDRPKEEEPKRFEEQFAFLRCYW